MKNCLLSAFIFSIASTLSAQITITNADMPDAGDSVRVSFALTTGSVDHTLTDTNYVWDFSSLIPYAQERVEFNSPTAFPFNFLSDMAVTSYTPDSLPGLGAIPSNLTDYYKSSSSSYRQVGSSFDYVPIGSFSIPLFYSAQDYVYRFPLNYGDMDTCDAAYGLGIPGIGYIGQDRHRENYVDGWGILITPLDTYQVVRIRSVVNAVDTISLDTTSPGFTIVRPTEIEYKWLSPGMKLPVLEVDCQILFSAEVVTNVIFQDSLRGNLWQVSVAENEMNQTVSVYPNPASGEIVVQYVLSGNDDATLQISDLNGKIVQTEALDSGNSAGIVKIDVSSLTPGMYFIKVENGSNSGVSKIIIY